MFGNVPAGLIFVLVTIVIPTCYTANYQADGEKYVKDIRQNYAEKLNGQLSQQVFDFSKSVLFYKAYASYFDRADVSLPGFSKFFLSLAEERIETAQNLTALINERGGHVSFNTVKLRQLCTSMSKKLGRFPHVCFYVLDPAKKRAKKASKPQKDKFMKYPVSYKLGMKRNSPDDVTPKMPTALSALEDSAALERNTNKDLIDLMAFTVRMKDPAMRVKLDAYLERQVDVIYNLANLVTRLSFYKDTDDYALGEYILDSELTY